MKPTLLIYLLAVTVRLVEGSDSWFVQEVVEYDEGGDPFSQEDLLPLRRQPSSPQTSHQRDGHHTAQKSPQKASADVVLMTSERHHADAKDTVASELEDQHLIPVKTGSKRKTKPVQAGSKTSASATSPKIGAKDVFKTEPATTPKRNTTEVKKDEPTTGRKGGERKLLSKEEEAHPVAEDDEIVEIRPEPKICEEPEKDVDCLFEEEELIPVIKKPRTPKKSPPKAKPIQAEKKSATPKTKGTAEKDSNHASQRKLLQIAESSSNERRVSNNSKIDIESRPGDDGNDVIAPATQEKPMQPPVEEKEEEEMEEEEEDLDDVLWRVRRQAGNVNDQEFSGDTSPVIPTTTTAATTTITPTPDPSFVSRTTGNITYETQGWDIKVDTRTCRSSPAKVEEDVRSMLEKYFAPVQAVVPGMQMTFDITSSGNGIVSWKMKLTKLGSTPENEIDKILARLQNLTQPNFAAGSCGTSHPSNAKTNFIDRVNTTLSYPCTAPDPCALGFEKCAHLRRGVGRCFSKCLTSGVNAKCENGAPCLTEPKGQPTCQCKAGYTGRYCEALMGDGSLPTALPPAVTNITSVGHKINLPRNVVNNRNESQIAEQIKKDLMQQFKDRNITDFDIEITNVTIKPDGSAVVNWNFKLGNANGNRQERALGIINSLVNLNTSFTVFNSSYTVPAVDLSNLGNDLAERLRNPCMETTCDFGFNCTLPYDYGDPTCTHKCLSNAFAQNCRHGTCELSRETGEPYCLCTNKYKGEFCDQPRTSDQQTAMSTPQIIGTTAGALIVAAAVASCCLYFLLCRKKSQRDISFSYLEDQDQDIEGFSDASSKLYNCYLDRPRVTVEPLDIYGMNQEFAS